MTDNELADKIDCDLHRLAEWAHEQADRSKSVAGFTALVTPASEWRKLATLIQAARAQSYSMLTSEQRKQLDKVT